MIEGVSNTSLESLQNSKGPVKDSPEKIIGAAHQFEALLIGQMMKSMQSDGGWLGSGEDGASSCAMQYGQEMFAQSMAQNGGLGLATLIAKGLQR